jgi:hypothetical protein
MSAAAIQIAQIHSGASKYATGAGKGTSRFGDSFKEKRDNVKENSAELAQEIRHHRHWRAGAPVAAQAARRPNLGAYLAGNKDVLPSSINPRALFGPPDPLIVEFVEVADLALLIGRIPYMAGVLGREAALNLRNVVAILIDNPCEIANLGRIAP